MDIRLRARLSAYSKVSDVSETLIPDPDETFAGHVLGVGQEGTYSFLPRVSEDDIDELFSSSSLADAITDDSRIDSLFNE